MKRLRALLPVLLLAVLIAGCSIDTAGIYGPTAAPGAFPGNDAHPQPHTVTFHGCPPGGDGGDTLLNTLKNRIDDGENGSYHDVSLDIALAANRTLRPITSTVAIKRDRHPSLCGHCVEARIFDGGCAIVHPARLAGRPCVL